MLLAPVNETGTDKDPLYEYVRALNTEAEDLEAGRLDGAGDEPGVCGQAEVVVRGEVDDRSAVHLDLRPLRVVEDAGETEEAVAPEAVQLACEIGERIMRGHGVPRQTCASRFR